ncbi:MAG: nucleotidyltransferase family protein [Labilithrix sp.]|nr:nucleotidyltransferase family protein [Labilithrix sp.]
MNLVDELHRIAAALRSASIDYAVCGGVAVTIHGATRTTKDIDLLVRREDVPRVLEAVRPLGYVFVALPMIFDAGTERERHVQRVSKLEGQQHLMIDLLVAEAAFAGLLDERLEIDLSEGTLRVVTLAALLAMKRLAGRPQDEADIEKLEHRDGT